MDTIQWFRHLLEAHGLAEQILATNFDALLRNGSGSGSVRAANRASNWSSP
jgi:hypothetical protein